MKQVYFIFQEGNDKICKIGKSIDAEKRVIQLQTGNPNKLELYEVLDGYTELENELHKRFSEQRIDGTEWFNLSKDEVDSLIEEYNETLESTDEESEEKELVEEIIEETKVTKRTYRVNKQNSYSCEKCSKTFSDIKYFKQHQNKQVPCDSTHICKKCGVEFTTAYNLRKHENKKIPCTSTKVPVLDPDNLENNCEFCGNNYATPYSLRRHLATCPMKDNQTVLIQLVLTKLNKIEEENKELVKSVYALQNAKNT